MNYYFSTKLKYPFDDVVGMVTKALDPEDFGIMTENDVKNTLEKKLNVDFRKYCIVGACNPTFALQALEVEDKIGTMLPCNVIVQETVDGDIEVSAVDLHCLDGSNR